MKYFFLLALSQFALSVVSAQKDFSSAFSFSTKVTGDFIYNFTGGIKQGYTYLGMEDFSIEFDTETAGWWKGGHFFVHGLNAHGNGMSENYTGDLQVLSNIDAGDYTGLYEFYYAQGIGNFSFLIGQHDLNTEFVGTKYGGTFINSSFGIVPSISLNMPVSIYPVAAPCLLLKYQSGNSLVYKFAVYDGDPGNFETNRFNLQWNINSKEGAFSIAEVEYNRYLDGQVSGTYKLGSYYHTGTFLNYTDTSTFHKGNYGIYAIVDQALFNRSLHAGRGLCLYFQGGITPQQFNQVAYYVGTGLRYHGIISNRYYDELGVAVAHTSMGKAFRQAYQIPKHSETAIEATYKFDFGRKYSIQPSLQYVLNPGAGLYKNCFVSLMRFSLEY